VTGGWVPSADGEEILHLGPNDDLDLSDWIEMSGGWGQMDEDEG
jgi:hypothetical protein